MLKQLAVVAVLGAAVAGLWWNSRPKPNPGWQGYAEADYVRVSPVLEGRLTAVLVGRGDVVTAGAPLFTQDDVADRAARDQARAARQQAADQLANLRAGGKPTEIIAAEADLADAQANLVRANHDLARVASLVPTGAATRQERDAMTQAARSALAHANAANARLEQARAPTGRKQEIAASTMALSVSEASLAQAEWRLAQRDVRAPAAGRVADVYARAGETLAAGSPVVELLPPPNILVRFFVPEGTVGALHAGDKVRIQYDGGTAPIAAQISFIAPQAEYTPPVIFSNETREKLVFLVEARPAPADAEKLHPGQPVSVLPVLVPPVLVPPVLGAPVLGLPGATQ